MEELRKFQSSTVDTIARRKLVEDQNTKLELSGRIQELQNEINCMSEKKEFQDAESIRSPHLGLDESGAHLCSGCDAIGRWARGYWSCEAAASVVVVTEEESESNSS